MSEDPPDEDKLKVLLQEYTNRDQFDQSAHRQLIQIATIGFSVIAGTVALLAPSQTTTIAVTNALNKGGGLVYWMLPVVFVVPFVLLIQVLFAAILNGYYLQEIEEEIAKLSKIDFFRYHRVEAKGLCTMKTGSPAVLATFGVIFLASAIVYFLLLAFCYNGLKSSEPIPGIGLRVVFWTLYIVLPLLVLWALRSALFTMRNVYCAHMKAAKEDEKVAYEPEFAKRSVFYQLVSLALVPKPLDLLKKSPVFLGSLVFATFVASPRPSWELVWLAFWVWISVEYMAKQTTYLWNDIVDLDEDKGHFNNQTRVVPRLMKQTGGKILPVLKQLFLVRTIVTILFVAVVSWSLGLGWWLWAVLSFIFVLQFFYGYWAKGGPIRKILLCPAGYAARGFAGAAVVMAFQRSYDWRFVLQVTLWTVVFAIMFMSHYWMEEAKEMKKLAAGRMPDAAEDPRIGQWFIDHGRRVQVGANLGLVFAGGWLVIDHLSRSFVPIAPLAPASITFGLVGAGVATGIFRSKNLKKTRSGWLIGIVAICVIAWVVFGEYPSRLILLAVGVPLLVGSLYHDLPYNEMKLKHIKPMLEHFIAAADRLMFGRSSKKEG